MSHHRLFTKINHINQASILIQLYRTTQLIESLSLTISHLVQTFHPNGRYGRRSSDMAEQPGARTELGQLQAPESLNLLHRLNNQGARLRRVSLSEDAESIAPEPVIGSLQSELSKLMKCSYSGIYNLYMCEN